MGRLPTRGGLTRGRGGGDGASDEVETFLVAGVVCAWTARAAAEHSGEGEEEEEGGCRCGELAPMPTSSEMGREEHSEPGPCSSPPPAAVVRFAAPPFRPAPPSGMRSQNPPPCDTPRWRILRRIPPPLARPHSLPPPSPSPAPVVPAVMGLLLLGSAPGAPPPKRRRSCDNAARPFSWVEGGEGEMGWLHSPPCSL